MDPASWKGGVEEVLDMLQEEKLTWADRVRREGQLEGQLEGNRQLLLRLAGRRFGTGPVETLASLLETVAAPDLLEEIGDWAFDCRTDEALLARLGQLRERVATGSGTFGPPCERSAFPLDPLVARTSSV